MPETATLRRPRRHAQCPGLRARRGANRPERVLLTRLVTGLGTAAAMVAGSSLWAQVGAPERLAATPTVSGAFWTIVVPLLVLAVSFISAYALYRHFSAK